MEEIYWIWIARLKNIRHQTILKLLERYVMPEKIYNLTHQELIENQLEEKEIKEILNPEYREKNKEYLLYTKQNGIEIIDIKNKYYPKKLLKISDPPIVLFVKGNKRILNETAIAIIGCRDASQYGKKIAEQMAYNLSENNINIISGLAVGIDAYAHIGVIKKASHKGKAIAVIGNGIDDIYPKENKQLAKVIVEQGGVILSEYLAGTKPQKMNFPARNRIISALSDGVLVIEAKEKSGTLITVDFALEQGKEVFAIPGNINNINSVGTNKLLKEGANFVTEAMDIISTLKIQ